MRAVVKTLHSPDAPDGLETFEPDDPSDFSLLVQALIGPADNDGEESFDFMVMSPSALAREAENAPKGFSFVRHRLVLSEWDPALVERAIEDLVRRADGEDWGAVATQLSRFGHWEFEDYRE